MHSVHSQVSTEIIRTKPDPKSPTIERRGRERLKCKRRPIVRVVAESRVHRAVVRDATRQGLGLLMERAFEVGAKLTIELQAGKAGTAGLFAALVRHCTQLGDGSWLVGCSLGRDLSAFELFTLV
jgi:hypothetical protein